MIVDKNFKDVGRGKFTKADKIKWRANKQEAETREFVKDTASVKKAAAAYNETVKKQIEALGLRKAGR